ncbi:hypothetical protein O6H91_14G063800 [Diphasiastrum complanatum]|uniref:Uncharacterized protein n=1 Tax=Diphasiastrum complanatum TaxID=34168 RepID=A0ACC2BQ87_DIPCM|nr:hypothetical protein O6H91_14G063800 [Diphasiastrum complanatum]
MAVSEDFPVGLRVMVVDDDPVCLLILQRMLHQCRYRVTTCSCATQAYTMLRERQDTFDLVISDVYMPDMDGFRLLELIGLELDLPVIMMSANGETSLVMKGITHGACDYLLKPVRIEELRNIWQHVVRKKGTFDFNRDNCSIDWDSNKTLVEVQSEDHGSRKRKGNIELSDAMIEDANSLKKARVVWSSELHKKFVNAVNQLGIDTVPKSIMEIMRIQGLTRENVASHLQKYRLGLKRLCGIRVERLPVASFQASENGQCGGKMQIQSGGSVSASGSNVSSNVGVFGRSLNQLDRGTLAALAQLQATQQRQFGVNEAQQLGDSGKLCLEHLFAGGTSQEETSSSGLQRMSSLELDLLMQQVHQGMAPRQQQVLASGDLVDLSIVKSEVEAGGCENMAMQSHQRDPMPNSLQHFTEQPLGSHPVEPEGDVSAFDLSRLDGSFDEAILLPSPCRLADSDCPEPGIFTFPDPCAGISSFIHPSPHDFSSFLDEILPP